LATVREEVRMDRRSTGVAALAVLVFGCATNPPLEVTDAVDLDRFVGRWYEIASFPQRFQQGCVATTATYSRRRIRRSRGESRSDNPRSDKFPSG